MNQLKTWFFSLMVMAGVLLLPIIAFAEEEGNPVKKIREKMKFNWKVLDGLDFLFSPLMIVLTLIVFAVLIVLIVRVIFHIYKISTGKESIKNKTFWIEMGFVILILFLLFSGAFFSILENIYEWQNDQDIGQQTTTG
ncbi:hypothetical protein [Paenibacillus sp. y28]|uniref:hypothetical protein n=1 Tax=Paenibacillus sp. y28 TaxID=3129110 RepID=UPI00301ACFE1